MKRAIEIAKTAAELYRQTIKALNQIVWGCIALVILALLAKSSWELLIKSLFGN